MPTIVYVDATGTRHAEEVAIGVSLMRGATENDVPGILAECGGAAACGTCRIVVEPEWRDRLPEPGPSELSMLEDAEEGSRLSCQITVSPELEGLVVHTPPEPY